MSGTPGSEPPNLQKEHAMTRAHRRPRKPRSDVGTVLLHWAMVAAMATSIVTGLAIAADNPARGWLSPLRAGLPQGEVWGLHLGAGLVIGALVPAYVLYMRSAGLTRRIALDRARLHALRMPGRARWGAVNVILYWLLFALIAVQIATGVLLYLGRGGTLVQIHYWSAGALIAFPVFHVLAQYAYGHLAQRADAGRRQRQARAAAACR
jgi:cytochrome b subunit of formate dehydrogenase